ncbi:MAG TPA: glycoside hydrolase family 3 N-terminal domain-containing protein [Ktedonobacterales bacterium]|nr:glycoside hydrolase family 3 N-terminal domain-containing protein [Ktedonobacterales bacterium]
MKDDPNQPWWAGPFWQQPGASPAVPPAAPPEDEGTLTITIADEPTARVAVPSAPPARAASAAPVTGAPATPVFHTRPGSSPGMYRDGEPTLVLPALGDRALADAPTAVLPAPGSARPGVWDQTTQVMAVAPRQSRRARSSAPSDRWKAAGRRVALVIALCALGIRAGMASLAFMAPGGDIVGWSRLPVVHHLAPVKNLPQQLTPEQYAAVLASQMSLDDQLGQMMIVQFVGTDLNPDLVTMVASQGAGGVLFFGGNIESANQVRALTANLQKLAPIPLLMAVDQEGGRVNRFEPIVGPLPSAASLQTPADARDRGAQDAALLHDYGFNLNLAPVVDVGEDNPQLYTRTFGTDPERVAAMAGAYIDGLQESGQVTAIPKHFPGGLGSIATDPHVLMPTLDRTRAEWEATDVAPYQTLFAEHDVRGVMISHELIPAVDPNLPTSLSPAIGTDTLRTQLGFQGVAITDDLVSMDAITARWSVPQASVLAIIAGSDIVTAPSYSDLVSKIKDEIKNALQDGRLTRARIVGSVRRILTLKIKMGLIPLPAAATPTASPAVAPTTIPTSSPQGVVPGAGWQRERAA